MRVQTLGILTSAVISCNQYRTASFYKSCFLAQNKLLCGLSPSNNEVSTKWHYILGKNRSGRDSETSFCPASCPRANPNIPATLLTAVCLLSTLGPSVKDILQPPCCSFHKETLPIAFLIIFTGVLGNSSRFLILIHLHLCSLGTTCG